MPLTIEDGTGVAGADSFATASEYEATLLDLFGETVTADESALRRAFLHMKSLNWKADCPFPTLGGTIPDEVKQAQAIFARYEVATPSGLAPTVVAGQQKILTRVGEIGWAPTGQIGVDAQRGTVTMAMDLLKVYLNDTGNAQFIQRA